MSETGAVGSVYPSLATSLAEPLALVVREGCSYREAARRLNRSPEVVARQLRRALQEIRTCALHVPSLPPADGSQDVARLRDVDAHSGSEFCSVPQTTTGRSLPLTLPAACHWP